MKSRKELLEAKIRKMVREEIGGVNKQKLILVASQLIMHGTNLKKSVEDSDIDSDYINELIGDLESHILYLEKIEI